MKYGLIGDADFFDWCEANAAALLAGDASAQAQAIEVSCRAKAKVVVSPDSVWIIRKDPAAARLDDVSFTAGIYWKIHHFMADLQEPVRYTVPDIFANASWSDEEE